MLFKVFLWWSDDFIFMKVIFETKNSPLEASENRYFVCFVCFGCFSGHNMTTYWTCRRGTTTRGCLFMLFNVFLWWSDDFIFMKVIFETKNSPLEASENRYFVCFVCFCVSSWSQHDNVLDLSERNNNKRVFVYVV